MRIPTHTSASHILLYSDAFFFISAYNGCFENYAIQEFIDEKIDAPKTVSSQGKYDMHLTSLPHANTYAYICITHLAIFRCLFQHICLAIQEFIDEKIDAPKTVSSQGKYAEKGIWI
jgi:hypothetical protein